MDTAGKALEVGFGSSAKVLENSPTPAQRLTFSAFPWILKQKTSGTLQPDTKPMAGKGLSQVSQLTIAPGH